MESEQIQPLTPADVIANQARINAAIERVNLKLNAGYYTCLLSDFGDDEMTREAVLNAFAARGWRIDETRTFSVP